MEVGALESSSFVSSPRLSLMAYRLAAIAAAVGDGTLSAATLELFIVFNQNNWSQDGRGDG